jgi:hypothetical protein
VDQLRAGSELLGHDERLVVWEHELRLDLDVGERRAAADSGALAHHVPVLVERHAGGVAAHEAEHQLVVIVNCGDGDPT